jgi:hypothetical protein
MKNLSEKRVMTDPKYESAFTITVLDFYWVGAVLFIMLPQQSALGPLD